MNSKKFNQDYFRKNILNSKLQVQRENLQVKKNFGCINFLFFYHNKNHYSNIFTLV